MSVLRIKNLFYQQKSKVINKICKNNAQVLCSKEILLNLYVLSININQSINNNYYEQVRFNRCYCC